MARNSQVILYWHFDLLRCLEWEETLPSLLALPLPAFPVWNAGCEGMVPGPAAAVSKP